MHSPKDAAGTFSVQSSRRANHFSFPPTQRKGLLEPTTRTRSSNQRVNLLRSYNDLLDALDVPQLQQSTA